MTTAEERCMARPRLMATGTDARGRTGRTDAGRGRSFVRLALQRRLLSDVVLLLCTAGARAYYLPGTVPVSYAVGDELQGNVSRGRLPSQPDGGDGGGGGKGGGRQGD